MDPATAQAISAEIKAIVSDIAPDIRYVAKYGGEVLCPDPGDDSQFVGGIFAYKAHVSLEFSEGAALSDPEGQLEGSGKHRRHLKFRRLADVSAKPTADLLRQALAS